MVVFLPLGHAMEHAVGTVQVGWAAASVGNGDGVGVRMVLPLGRAMEHAVGTVQVGWAAASGGTAASAGAAGVRVDVHRPAPPLRTALRRRFSPPCTAALSRTPSPLFTALHRRLEPHSVAASRRPPPTL
eukprot:365460-Chlamydomonas_euryale.AAC.6